MNKHITIILLILLTFQFGNLYSQEKKYDIDKLSKKEILAFSYDDLLEMPFMDLKKLADKIGVSSDELLKMVLNREVSSASKKGESVFQSPLSTTVISKEEIKLSGATTYEELFRLVPGMIVRQESNGNFDIHIRGNDNLPPGNFSYISENMITLVAIDGRAVYNYITGGTFWETLPVGLSDIERIEIIRGASSALYGPNAVAGVINIITRHPEQDGAHVHGNLQAGNYNTYTGSFSILNKINEKLGVKISSSFDYRDRSQNDFYEYLSGKYKPVDSLTSMFNNSFAAKSTDPDLAKHTFNANAAVYYDVNSNISTTLSTGLQNSQVQRTFFENLATPFGLRTSQTGYVDLKSNIYGISAQVNYLVGSQNLHEKMIKPVIEYDMNFLTANVEYDWLLNDLGIGDLTIRPGFNYQRAAYNDKSYVESVDTDGDLDMGMLNGEKSLSVTAGSIRLDYRPIPSLRIIGALRADKYNIPDTTYLSWQFVGSYSLNNKHLFRLVYSRANRSAFMANNFAKFKNPLGSNWSRNPLTGDTLAHIQNYFQYYQGNQDLKLMTQDLIEFGYRGIISDWAQIDLEAFYNTSKNYDALYPKSMSAQIVGMYQGYPDVVIDDIWEYSNIDMESSQTGATISLSIMPKENLLIKLFGTYQNTKLTNYVSNISDIYANNAVNPGRSLPDSVLHNSNNDWTPSFYGGAMVNYALNSKLNFNLSAYYYSKETYSRYFYDVKTNTHTNIQTEIDPSLILNFTATYRTSDNTSVFANVRNLLDNNKTEFAYNDRIRALYLVGVNFNF